MKNLKKDFIFAPILFVIGVLLFLLKATGLPVHIAVSVAGVVTLVAYSVLTKKEWKIPALEIAMRASYGLALISGIVIKISYIPTIAIIHKLLGVLFVILLAILFVYKIVTEKSEKAND